jgi:hypothetical protein
MTLAIILVIAAVLALVVVLRATLSRGLQVSTDRSLADQLQTIDVAAFRNLVDPAEDDYLRRRLPAAEFRMVQRQRLLATAVYVKAANRNAAILILMGQKAQASSNAHTAEAARQLVENATVLRQNASIAILKIYVARVWPHASLGSTPVVQRYERLNLSAMLLGRLQNPASPVRIAATS